MPYLFGTLIRFVPITSCWIHELTWSLYCTFIATRSFYRNQFHLSCCNIYSSLDEIEEVIFRLRAKSSIFTRAMMYYPGFSLNNPKFSSLDRTNQRKKILHLNPSFCFRQGRKIIQLISESIMKSISFLNKQQGDLPLKSKYIASPW